MKDTIALAALLASLAGAVAVEWPAALPCGTDSDCECVDDCLEPALDPFVWV